MFNKIKELLSVLVSAAKKKKKKKTEEGFLDMDRRAFMQLIGLAGLALPLIRLDDFDPRNKIMLDFLKSDRLRLDCKSVDDYLYFTEFCYKRLNMMTYDDPFRKDIGVVVRQGEYEEDKYINGSSRERIEITPLSINNFKLINLKTAILDEWIADNNIDDTKFRELSHRPAYDEKKIESMRNALTGMELDAVERKVRISKIKFANIDSNSEAYKASLAAHEKNYAKELELLKTHGRKV